jgi:hypothetical protein
MKTTNHNSPEQATSRTQSTYFQSLHSELVRLYGENKGTRLANRYWEIRNKYDHRLQEERIKIVMGLA